MQRSCYTISKLKIIYEVLSTEAVIINFDTGDYYSMHHIAKHVWQLLEHKIPTSNMTQLIATYFKQDEEKIKTDLTQLLTSLEQENLIIPVEASEASECNNLEEIIGQDCRDWAYDRPIMQKFSDVQGLLTIDPIHEVTEAGWPTMDA